MVENIAFKLQLREILSYPPNSQLFLVVDLYYFKKLLHFEFC